MYILYGVLIFNVIFLLTLVIRGSASRKRDEEEEREHWDKK